MFVAAAQPTAGLVAYFPLNGNFNSTTPTNIAGTINGATPTTNIAGTANSAMNFLNPGSTVPQFGTHAINANTSFGINQDFTIVFSVYANSPFVHTGGFYDNNLNTYGPGVWFWNANGYPQIQFNFRNSSSRYHKRRFCDRRMETCCLCKIGWFNHDIHQWRFECYRSGGTGTPVYNIPARFGTMSYYLYSPPEYNGFNGKMDELRIYNRALTAAEIIGMSGGALPVKLTSFTASEKTIPLR